ncbi:MAG: PaeR7I family type II restriction endonuclease [Terriglobales bacterium]
MNGELELKLKEAVARFWTSRETQAQKQGSKSGSRDTGSRAAVTGGSQMDGFVELVRDLLEESGVDKPVIYCERSVEIPGWFRPEKKWDLLVVVEGCLIAAIEFKSQVGSFGNNYNNRTEEAVGSATDLWAAYREGAFKPSARPWLGYVMLLEEAPGSTRPVKAQEPHFKVFDEFRSASYARRYEMLLTKLMRERLYDATSFLMSTSTDGPRGQYTEPAAELSFTNFVSSLLAKAIAYKKTR